MLSLSVAGAPLLLALTVVLTLRACVLILFPGGELWYCQRYGMPKGGVKAVAVVAVVALVVRINEEGRKETKPKVDKAAAAVVQWRALQPTRIL